MRDNRTRMIAGAARVGVAAVMWVGLAAGARAQQFEDDNTQKSFSVPGGAQNVNVHVCKGNALLIGVDVAHNRFLCEKVSEPLGPLFVDTNNHFPPLGPVTPIHTCATLGTVGTSAAMVGLSVDRNWLICVNLPPSGWTGGNQFGNSFENGPPGAQAPEPNYPSVNMHVCPNQYGSPTALLGIKVDKNVFACTWYTVYPSK